MAENKKGQDNSLWWGLGIVAVLFVVAMSFRNKPDGGLSITVDDPVRPGSIGDGEYYEILEERDLAKKAEEARFNDMAEEFAWQATSDAYDVLYERERQAEDARLDAMADAARREQEGTCGCYANLYNCKDFSSQEDAQACYAACLPSTGDIHWLDDDGDGIACELLQ